MLADDARTVAKQTGQAESAAMALLVDEDILDPYLASLPEDFPEAYAGSWTDDRGVHVRFKGAIPTAARARIPTSLQVLTVDLIPDNGFNLREAYDLQDQVVDKLEDAKAVDYSVVYDHPTASIEVVLGGGAKAPSALAKLSTQSGLPIPINVESFSASTTVDFQIRGGAKEKIQGVSLPQCTSAFAINRFITGTPPTSVSSMTTAAHCRIIDPGFWIAANPGSNWFYMTRDFYGFGTGNGDAEVYHTSTGESAAFYYDTSSYRNVTGQLNIITGKTICHFGWGSNSKSCSEVENTNGAFSSSGLSFKHMIFMANTTAADGDSGGPWFSGGKAAGIHSGRVSLPNGNTRLFFTPISQISSTTGVGIALKVAN